MLFLYAILQKLSEAITNTALIVVLILHGIGLLVNSTSSEAALFDRGSGLIYDDVLDVTWLMDASYASSTLTETRINEIIANNTLVFNDGHILTESDFFLLASGGTGDAGLMKWWGAMAWANQLEFFDAARNVTYSDWRLPTMNPVSGTFNIDFSNNGTTDFGYGSIGPSSEMNYMYYENLGNLGICTPNGDNSSTSCVTQSGWGLNNTGPFANVQTQTYWSNTELGSEVFAFDFGVGFQGLKTESNKNNQLHAWAVRDGDVAIVPIPASIWLFISGLISLCYRSNSFCNRK